MTGTAQRRFRPGIGATVATAIALAVLLALGTWQVQRLAWKESLIAARARAEAMTPARPDTARAFQAMAPYRQAVLAGRFLVGADFFLRGRVRQGVPGVQVVTPFALGGGGAVLIDRGFLPLADPSGPASAAPPPAGVVTVTVEALPVPAPSRFAPDGDPAAGLWYRVDPAAMAASVPGLDLAPGGLYGRAVDVVAPAGGGPSPGGVPGGFPGGVPVPSAPPPAFANAHLGYAVTWYGLAVGLIGVYIAFGLRRS